MARPARSARCRARSHALVCPVTTAMRRNRCVASMAAVSAAVPSATAAPIALGATARPARASSARRPTRARSRQTRAPPREAASSVVVQAHRVKPSRFVIRSSACAVNAPGLARAARTSRFAIRCRCAASSAPAISNVAASDPRAWRAVVSAASIAVTVRPGNAARSISNASTPVRATWIAPRGRCRTAIFRAASACADRSLAPEDFGHRYAGDAHARAQAVFGLRVRGVAAVLVERHGVE